MSAEHVEKGLFASRKRQRRALWIGGLLLVAGVAAALIAFAGNTADTVDTPRSNEAAQLYAPKKQITDVPADVREVAGKFIQTAVARKNVASSYDITHPELRQGMTRKQWATGDIPVVYYPAEKVDVATFKVDEAYDDEVYLEVALIPKQSSGIKPQIFHIGLKRVGGKDGAWKVSYWVPRNSIPIPNPAGSG